jgi:hypothetical protein
MKIPKQNQGSANSLYSKAELKRLAGKVIREKKRKAKWKEALEMQLGLVPKHRRKIRRRNGLLYWTY